MFKKLNLFTFIIFAQVSIAQQIDTSKVITLNEVQIVEKNTINEIERLPAIQGTIIYSGKKNEVIKVDLLDADLSTNNPRQIFGLF